MTDHPPVRRLREAVARTAAATRDRTRTGLSHDDADDDLGTWGSDDAIGYDPMPLLSALSSSGCRAVVIGQVAGIMHGSTELTGDLDLLWDGDPGQVPDLVAAFTAAGAEVFDSDGRPLPVDAAAFALPKVTFRTRTASGDCCTPALPWGGLDVTGFIERAATVTADGLVIHYLGLDDLIAMREALDRPKDRRRATELRGIRDRVG